MAELNFTRREKLEEVECLLRDYDYVRVVMCDIHGVSRGKLLPAPNAIKYLRRGMGAFAGLVAINPRAIELQEVKDSSAGNKAMREGGNMVMEPVLDTFRCAPWAGRGKYKVAEVICEMRWTDGSPDLTCPRYLARQQLKRLDEMGYTFLSGIELEFRLLDSKTMKPPVGFEGDDFYSTLLLSENMEVLCETEQRLRKAGVNIEDMHVEPAAGQFEINFQPAWGILGGDWPFLIREALKETSSEYGYQANFMPKPFPTGCGNGAHFNHSVWDKEKKVNIFYDESKSDRVADFTRHWVAGLVKHTIEMAAITCPTVNCYRRMYGPWAPSAASWGVDDRLSTYRVKNFGPTSSYVENRVPSGVANPYLLMACTIAAGLDGVIKKLEPTEQGLHTGTQRMPGTLEEALQAFEKSELFKKTFGEDFVNWYCLTKRVGEIEMLKDSKVSDANDEAGFEAEREMYAKFV